MSCAIDASMRKLKIPPRFVPYMEQHRIYELFYDLGESLAMNQPDDHVCFLKDLIKKKMITREFPIVTLITPPYIDKPSLAFMISKHLQIRILSRHIICKDLPQFLTDPDNLAIRAAEAVSNENAMKYGCIFVDFPNTKEEAKALIKHKILPTHTLHLIPSGEKDCAKKLWFEYAKFWSSDELQEALKEYKRNLHFLKEIFRSSIKEILIEKKNLQEIISACCQIILKMPNREPSIIFRVVLIGPRGSQRRTLAKLLHQRFNLVHVDMEEVINKVRIMDNELGDEIRDLDKRKVRIFGRIIIKLLEERLLEEDCLNNGYVLTHFPRDENDFILLDLLDTPPNRVIFLDISTQDCKNRLVDRCINMYTGEIYSKSATKSNFELSQQLLTHPEDTECKVDFDHENFTEYLRDMKTYCMSQCSVVNAREPLPRLYEAVEGILMSSSPIGLPRNFKPSQPSLASSSTFYKLDELKLKSKKYAFRILPKTSSELMNRYKNLKDIDISMSPDEFHRVGSSFMGYVNRSSVDEYRQKKLISMNQESEDSLSDELDHIVERFKELRGF